MATGLARVGKHAESVTLAGGRAAGAGHLCNVAATLVRQGLFQQGRFAEAARDDGPARRARPADIDGMIVAEDPDKSDHPA